MGAQAHKATRSARPAEVEHRWLVVDAEGVVLGRLASRIASILRGKHRPIFTPHVDTGDHVVVINAEKVKLTGNKTELKVYRHFTGWPGGVRSITAGKLLGSAYAERVIESAVQGMLPKNSLGRNMLKKLRVYTGPNHPHAAQQPEVISIG